MCQAKVEEDEQSIDEDLSECVECFCQGSSMNEFKKGCCRIRHTTHYTYLHLQASSIIMCIEKYLT